MRHTCFSHSKYVRGCFPCRVARRNSERYYRQLKPEVQRNANRRFRMRHSDVFLLSFGASLPRSFFPHNSFVDKIRALRLLGGSCVGCGETDIRLLTINHINGGGRKGKDSKRLVLSGQNLHNFDVRCRNCQILFEYERGRLRYPESLSKHMEELDNEILSRT